MQNIKLLTGVFFLMILGLCRVQAQNAGSIYGTVKDETQLPLPGATVFLTGTKSVTGTNSDGAYKLSNIAAGTYQIVIKMIGFKPYVKMLRIISGSVIIDAGLQPDNQLLKEVKIHPDYDREKHLALFKKQF